MDLQSIKVQLEQGRRFETSVDGATFTLRLPPEHTWRTCAEGNRDAAGRILQSKVMRVLLDGALVGWTGVGARHFMPDGDDEAVPFSTAARAELLDSRQDIADALGAALAERREAHRERMEAARKNLSPASSGS